MSRFTPLILAVALFMEMMDSTVIATSLPAIAADIGADPIALKLAMTSYLVALAIFIPVSGWMADRFGARNVFRWAIFVFVLGSIACAMANSLPYFVGARFFQGMGGSMMTPLARLVMVRTTPKKDLVSAMAWLTVPALIGPMLGPPIGGFLTTFFSWHWIFLINVPIGALGILTAGIFLPKIEAVPPKSIDWRGFFLAATCFAGLLFGFSVISLPALPPVVGIVTAIIGLGAGIVYLWHARRTENPLLDPRLFRNPLFRAAILGGLLFRIAVGATPFLFPLMLQVGFGRTPFETGTIMFSGAIGAILAKFFAKSSYQWFGFKRLLIGASIVGALSLTFTGTFTAETPAFVMMATLIFTGIIRSTFFTGINALVFAETGSDDAGQATSMLAVSAQLSLALGVAVAGAMLEITTTLRGTGLTVADFHTAFLAVALVGFIAFIPFTRLRPDAGSDVSGHRSKRNAVSQSEAALGGE